MSKKQVALFYAELHHNAELFAKASALQNIYKEQEQVLDAFIELGRQHGFIFTAEDLVNYIYENGTEESSGKI